MTFMYPSIDPNLAGPNDTQAQVGDNIAVDQYLHALQRQQVQQYLDALNQQQQGDLSGAFDNGGGGGGGGGGGAGATPAKVLESSPEWQAYLNSLGLQRTQFAADIARQRALGQSQLNYNLAQLEPQFQIERRNITANAEGRGMSQSGQLLRSLAENRAAEGRQQASLQQGFDTSTSNLESQLAQKNMDLDSQAAQQKLSMVGSGAFKSDPNFYNFLNK